MGYVQTALRFSEDALVFAIGSPFCLLFTIAAIVFVRKGLKQRPFRTGLWKPRHWLILRHLLFFPAAIAVGVLFANPLTGHGPAHPANRFAVLCLNTLGYGSLASCAFWIWRMKGFRWFAAGLMILMELPMGGAVFVAGMSVTGDWI